MTVGIPVSEPTDDVGSAQQILAAMGVAYPVEMFTVEDAGGKLVVTWIPIWSAEQWLQQALASRLQVSAFTDWPGKF